MAILYTFVLFQLRKSRMSQRIRFNEFESLPDPRPIRAACAATTNTPPRPDSGEHVGQSDTKHITFENLSTIYKTTSTTVVSETDGCARS